MSNLGSAAQADLSQTTNCWLWAKSASDQKCRQCSCLQFFIPWSRQKSTDFPRQHTEQSTFSCHSMFFNQGNSLRIHSCIKPNCLLTARATWTSGGWSDTMAGKSTFPFEPLEVLQTPDAQWGTTSMKEERQTRMIEQPSFGRTRNLAKLRYSCGWHEFGHSSEHHW